MVMAVIGLTGGIASGKSTVASRFAEHGVPVIDADQVAREVVAPGEPALERIRVTFGAEMIQADGSLDRPRLGARVFSDPAALRTLNAITHPAIFTRVGNHLANLQADGHPWCLYEAALVIENGLAPGMSELIVVLCEPETQVTRLMARNDLDETAARQRLAAQTDNAKRREAASVVIDNDGTRAELLARADDVFETLCARYGAPLDAGGGLRE